MAIISAGAAATAAGLFGFNRENWMFDRGIIQERTYFGQEMKVKTYELYREDIHDLMELTVSKMDVYIVVLVLELLFCIMLFTEGMPKPHLTPEWMHWLFACSSATAVLYLVLSTWLGMHASIAAHSWGVRMLTQSVRLPIPSARQIHAASAMATDFEESSILTDMLRVPVVQQRMKETTDTMGNSWRSEGQTDLQMEQFLGKEDMAEPGDVGMLPHIQKWRELQAHWQAYDAYCRVCMAMGTNQILHSMCYYCLGVMLAELKTVGCAALFCIVVFAYTAFLILRLDLWVDRKTLIRVGAFQIAAPLVTCLCLWGTKAAANLGKFPPKLEYLVPLTFVLNMLWILQIIDLARDHSQEPRPVALPSQFRGVLYLDVFGWLSDESLDPSSTRAAAGTEAVAESRQSSLQRLCRQTKESLELQLVKWEGASELVQDSRLADLRAKFDAVVAALAATATQGEEATPEPTPEAQPPIAWLQLEWNSAGRPVPYWYNPDTEETRWEKPEVPALVLDLEQLSAKLDQFDARVKALQRLQESGAPAQTVCLEGSAEASATFYPEAPEAEFTSGERSQPDSSRPPPGDLPWRTFYQGSMVVVGIWAIGTVWSSAQVYLGFHIPIRPVPGPGLQSWVHSRALELELVSDRRWPHTFFNPKGLGCHSTLGPGRIFVAEAHALHEMQLIAGEGRSASHASWQPALQQCLEQVPDFVANGIRGVSIHCPEGKPMKDNWTLQDADGHCSAVLLGALGQSLLSCQLQGSANASASKVVVSHLYGGPWAAVAAISKTESPPSSRAMGIFWAQGQATLVQLGSQALRAAGLQQDGADGPLVPLLEVSSQAQTIPTTPILEVDHMVALSDGSGVLTLTPEGLQLRSLGWPQQLHELRLPQGSGARWAGLCSPGGRELLLVGRRARGEDYALWRTELPSWL